MKIIKLLSFSIMLLALVSCGVSQEEYSIDLVGDDLIVTAPDGSKLEYKPEFIILCSDKDPNKQLRKPKSAELGYELKDGENMGLSYSVPTWGIADDFKIDPSVHIEDGFDPKQDRSIGNGRTANYFAAGNLMKAVAASAEKVSDEEIRWQFPDNDNYAVSAIVRLSDCSEKIPELVLTFLPKKDGWYSVGYSGAPDHDIEDCDEIWQAHIWNEKRFHKTPFLSEAFRASVPTTLVSCSGITNGVVADPAYIPFDPIPTTSNSQFGVMVRNVNGKAQPQLFAPVLGGVGSRMQSGQPFSFSLYLFHKKQSLLDSYEWLSYNIMKFKDIRENTTCNLNTTIENNIEYLDSKFAMFADSLRGCNYSTDVPGAVKNISGLLPLETAILTDDAYIYKRYSRPMLEYGLSRERFLFSPNDKVKSGQGVSSRLRGPGVPMSDLATAYTYSGNKLDYFYDEATKIYDDKVVRSLNLDAVYYGDRWQNALFLYDSGGDSKYLAKAEEDADKYLKERVYKKQTDFYDKLSMGLFFWTSYTNQYMELLQMYYATGEKKYLDAAEEGARYYTQFCWMSPSIPEGKIVINKDGKVPVYRPGREDLKYMSLPETEIEAWRVSEQGLTPESSGTSAGGHRAIFMAHHAPFMMRIAALTGDKFLHDVARSAVVGRYEGFPGYHINAGRTNAFEMKDFAFRPQNELNGHTSIHYNHGWSFVAMLWDYLVSDFYYVSDMKIDFPTEYAEGYAYCRSMIYGAHPGSFYDEQGVNLYMPSGLVNTGNVQLNYLSGYGNGKLYVALSNQSHETQRAEISFDNEKACINPAEEYKVRVWVDNKEMDGLAMTGGRISLDVSANGIVAIAIDGVEVKTDFQERLYGDKDKWQKNYTSVGFENDRAVIIDFGKGLKSVYVWNESDNYKYSETTLHYAIDGKWAEMSKKGYPYEYTVELPDGASDFEYYFTAVGVDGKTVKTETGALAH